MESQQSIPCPLCNAFQAPSSSLLWSHATKPGFHIKCNIDSCSRTFINMKTYDNHLSRNHFMHGRTVIPELFMSEEANGDENNGDENNSEENNGEENNGDGGSIGEGANNSMNSPPDDHGTTRFEELKHAGALWIQKIREKCKLTQSSIDEIIQGVTDFNSYILSKLYNVLKNELEGININISDLPQLTKVFDTDSPFLRPFKGIETHHQHLQYCKKKLGFVVILLIPDLQLYVCLCYVRNAIQEPVAIKLGTDRKWKGHGKKRKYQEVDETMMYIPLQKTIQTMLEDKTILNEVCL